MRYVLGGAVVLGLAIGAASALAQQVDADLKPVVGFVRVDAAKYFAEEQRWSPYGTRVLAKNGFRFGLYEWRTLFGVPMELQDHAIPLCRQPQLPERRGAVLAPVESDDAAGPILSGSAG